PSRSLARTSSVTESAVCRESISPSMSVCRARVWSSCSLSASQNPASTHSNSRLKLNAILCLIAIRVPVTIVQKSCELPGAVAGQKDSRGFQVSGKSGLGRGKRNFLNLYKFISHSVAGPLQTVALHEVGA